MAFRGLLRHRLAIVTPGVADVDNLDESGFPVQGEPTVRLVRGLVQPRDAHEVNQPSNAGAEYADFMIFLEPMPLSAASYITDATRDGIVSGGRRFQITGVQPFDYGSAPHLEVLARLVGSTE